MSKYQPNVGDLVCYNAAGMRKHSLGLVLERRREALDSRKPFDKVPFIFIQWIEKPSRPPRSEFQYRWLDGRDIRHQPRSDETEAWYQDKGCFEVLS